MFGVGAFMRYMLFIKIEIQPPAAFYEQLARLRNIHELLELFIL